MQINQTAYQYYCERVWKLVDLLLTQAQTNCGVELSSAQLKYARTHTLWCVVEVTQLPVDLSSHPQFSLALVPPDLPSMQEVQQAIAVVNAIRQEVDVKRSNCCCRPNQSSNA